MLSPGLQCCATIYISFVVLFCQLYALIYDECLAFQNLHAWYVSHFRISGRGKWSSKETSQLNVVVSSADIVHLSALILPFKVISFMSHSRPMGPYSCGATSKTHPPLSLAILLEGVIKFQGIQESIASEEQCLDAGIPYGRDLLYRTGKSESEHI